MNPIAVITLLAFFILMLTLFREGTDVFSPGRLFSLIWLLAIGLTELKLSRFQFDWTLYSWFALIVPIVSFLLGVFIVYVLNCNNKVDSIITVRKQFRLTEINVHMLYAIIIVLFVLYSISFIVTYMIRGFLPMFTRMPEVARTKWGVFGYGVFVLSIPTILYLSFIYLVLVKERIFNKVIVSAIVLVATASYATLLNRFYLILPIVLLVIALYYKTFKLRPRNMLLLLILFCFVFFGISTIRMSRYAINILFYLSDMKYNIHYAIFTEPYMYVTMNLENYARAVEKLNIFTYGYFSSDFLLFATGLKQQLMEYMRIAEFPYIITSTYNTYTMFFIYYRDFGLFGILVIPLILGLGISTVYYKMRKYPDLVNVSLYGLCVFVLVFSFFVPILHWIHFVFNVTIVYLSTMIITRTVR